jgi:hypothetical protein
VEPQLSSVLPLEVLDRIGHIDRLSVDANGAKRIIEQLSGRTDERMPGPIFDVARLFADEHQEGRPNSPFPEDRLGRTLIEIATFAVLGRRA